MYIVCLHFYFFFFNDTATTEIYTLSLHDALPICLVAGVFVRVIFERELAVGLFDFFFAGVPLHAEDLVIVARSEEHTSELQSLAYLVCRLLLEKKKKFIHSHILHILLIILYV